MGAGESLNPLSLLHRLGLALTVVYAPQIMRIPPENFRTIADLLEKETKGEGRVESMGYAVVAKEEKLE